MINALMTIIGTGMKLGTIHEAMLLDEHARVEGTTADGKTFTLSLRFEKEENKDE